jgi:hypothetical protein
MSDTCTTCNGEGVIHTGIDEAPVSDCSRCDGTGYPPLATLPAAPAPTDRNDCDIDAAEKLASLYDDDDRQDIKADVMNSFYAGLRYERAAQPAPAPIEQAELPRVDFEAWAATKYPLALQSHSLGGYARSMKQCAKEGWDAALAARQAPTAAPKDHNVRQLVNDLRDIALTFHATQQLRARISDAVGQFLAAGIAADAAPAAPEGQAAALAKLDRVSRWINKFPIPTDGATAMMCLIRGAKGYFAAVPRQAAVGDASKSVFNILPTMTAEDEKDAERGICPACKYLGLKEISAAHGMSFMACHKCKDITVLRATAEASQLKRADGEA